jgi:hypothetical protein
VIASSSVTRTAASATSRTSPASRAGSLERCSAPLMCAVAS